MANAHIENTNIKAYTKPFTLKRANKMLHGLRHLLYKHVTLRTHITVEEE